MRGERRASGLPEPAWRRLGAAPHRLLALDYGGALMVNPFDIIGVADALHRAFHMPRDERVARMRTLRRNVARQNVFRWVDTFLDYAFGRHLDDFPVERPFVPTSRPRDPEGTSDVQ